MKFSRLIEPIRARLIATFAIFAIGSVSAVLAGEFKQER